LNFLLTSAFARSLLPRFFSDVVPTMGIKQTDAPALRVRRSAIVEDLTELAGSRAPAKTPQRQRGLWSFLTWPFVIAPIVAAESFLAGNSHVLAAEDQDDRAADHGKGQPDASSDQDQAAAGAAHAADDSQGDQTDGPRALGTLPKALHDGDLPHEEHAKAPVAHDTVATASPASDSGGGGGGDSGGSNDANAGDTNSSDANAALASDGAAGGGSSGDLGGMPSGISTDLSHQIIIGASTSGGLSIDVSIGGEPGLALTTSDPVSTLTGGVADILAPVGLSGLGSSLDLKDILGFDLQVNSSGEFIATDLTAALDLHPLSSITNTVSTIASPVADSLPVLNLATSNVLDDLFGGDNHSPAGPLGDLSSIIGSSSLGGDEATSALTGSLGSNGTASPDKLVDALLAPSSDGSLGTALPVAGAISDPAPVSIVGEATAITPGHSIDFPAPVLPEGDVLFRGSSYTDYHVALQTVGPSTVSNSIATTLTSVASTPDATSLAHVDAPVANPAVASSAPTAQHQDESLTHIATTLDELSLRSHTH
jgi:hypothetical protein